MMMITSFLAAARRAEFLAQLARKTHPFGMPLKGMMLVLLILAARASAGTISVQIPSDLQVDKAVATTEKEPKSSITGVIKSDTVTFADPTPGSAYEIQLTLKDGTVLQGVDMGWYSRVPDKANAEELTDDDRQQMKAVFTAGAQFFNVQEAVIIKGNHNRAVMLVREERTNKFHSDTGDEIIWSPQLWYFQNNHGGWEKVTQTDRPLRRERFPNQAAYHAVVDKLKWAAELGGLKSTPKNPDVKITLPPNAGIAMNQSSPPSSPSSQPTDGAKP
jgi:hypothetical protein